MSRPPIELPPPAYAQLLDENGLKSVKRTSDDSWLHGVIVTEIFYREHDDTFWRVVYELSTDGETNGLRDGIAAITKVRPHAVEVIEYREVG